MAPATESNSFALRTPVLFFIFNRPELTRRVFAAIRDARPPHLLLVADGPRHDRPGDAALCHEARDAVLSRIDWPCSVSTELAEQNLGCGARLFSGLQWAFAHVTEAIILEDDCLPHPTFFRFCEEMLARYRDEPRVFMIAGTNFRGADANAPDRHLFSRHCSVWGWATWRRALPGYSLDLDWWRTSFPARELRSECADADEFAFVSALLDAQKFGAVNTWDVQWFAHVFRRHGLSVVPGVNLISNLGALGRHTARQGQNHDLPTRAAQFPVVAPAQLERDVGYDRDLVAAHRPPGGWLLGRLVARALRSGAAPLLRASWRAVRRLDDSHRLSRVL